MTATATKTATKTLPDSKGFDLEIDFFVKTVDHPKVAVTRIEAKSKRVVLRTEDGKLIARKASRVTALKNKGRVLKVKRTPAPAKAKA